MPRGRTRIPPVHHWWIRAFWLAASGPPSWPYEANTLISYWPPAGTFSWPPTWVLLALAGALLLAHTDVVKTLFKRGATWVVLGIAALASLASLAWYLKPPITSAGGPVFEGAGSSFASAFMRIIIDTLEFAKEWIGIFGWVDRPAPTITVAIWTTAIVALLVAAVSATRGRARLVTILFALSVILVPAIAQAAVVTEMGYIWQGRYTLALLVCLLIACGVGLDERFPGLLESQVGRSVATTSLFLLALAQLCAFIWTLKRYVVGEQASSIAIITDPAWQPPLGWPVLSVLATVTFGMATWVCVRSTTRQLNRVQSPSVVNGAS